MNDKKERILEVIKKCLSLSKDNPSAEESIAAALKAQQLMVKYSVEEYEVMEEIQDEPIEEIANRVGIGRKWKYQLVYCINDI